MHLITTFGFVEEASYCIFSLYNGKLSMFASTFMKVCNTGQLLTKFVEFVSVTEITFQLPDLH